MITRFSTDQYLHLFRIIYTFRNFKWKVIFKSIILLEIISDSYVNANGRLTFITEIIKNTFNTLITF
jgi:hypothetical protein